MSRIWSYFFGKGIVEPVDDFRSTNPPTHPELLQALAKDFRESGYSVKHLISTIVQSRTYQLSVISNETNKNDRNNWSHSQPRALEAAVLLDAITGVTGVPEKFEFHPMAGGGDPPLGSRAMQMMPDICPSQFMDVFGRSMRKAVPGAPPEPNVLQAMHMIAGQTYTSKITEEVGRLDRLLKKRCFGCGDHSRVLRGGFNTSSDTPRKSGSSGVPSPKVFAPRGIVGGAGLGNHHFSRVRL